MKANSVEGYLIIFFCIMVWGSSYVAIKIGLEDFTPTQVASYRFAIAGLASLVMMIVNKTPLPSRLEMGQIMLVAFFGIFLYHISITYSTTYFHPNIVSFVSNTAPLFMLILSKFLLSEDLVDTRWSGFALAMIGVLVMNFSVGAVHLDWAHLALFLIPVSSAVFFVLQKPLLRKMKSTHVMNYCIVVGALMLNLWDFSFISKISINPIRSQTAIVYLGILPTIVAFQLWSYLLSRTKVSDLSGPLYLVPVSTVICAYIMLDTSPEIITLAGGAITLLGVVLSKKSNGK